MGSRVRDVSVDLRNLDGIILEGDSDRENEGKGSAVVDILKMHDKAMHRWNTFFIILSAFAVFIDPLFLYIDVIEEDYMSFRVFTHVDWILVWTYLGLRTACDIFYIIDIIVFFCGMYKKRKGNMFGACWKRRGDKPRVLAMKDVIRKRDYLLLPIDILPRILVSLPIPAGLLFCSHFARRHSINFDPFYVIIIITPFQYTLRIFLIYGSQRWHPIKKTTTGKWLKPLLDFLPFILASYLFGALYYRLAFQRQIDCLKPHCEERRFLQRRRRSSINDFNCFFDNYEQKTNTMRMIEICLAETADSKVFDFGIFAYAVQSNLTGSSDLWQKILPCFWWALRNLSSFGSNLSTSRDKLEILFSVVISICGMALFLVYLNARVQESKTRSDQLKLNEKKHLMKPDIDLWLSKNGLSNLKSRTNDSKDLKQMVKKKKALKTVIIENMVKLEENKDIDLLNIISILPIKFRNSIIRLLCLASLKKVPRLANLNEKMLKVICEHLKPVIYTEDNYIVQEGKPLGMMLFITQGLAWSYTTKTIDGGRTSVDSSSNEWLKQGDFYGEELLNWAFKSPSFSALPLSTRTVMSQEKVEAFALRASDLKKIVCKFWWHFTRKLEQVDLEKWENSAASSIQAAWRNRMARSRRSNCWDRFTAHY